MLAARRIRANAAVFSLPWWVRPLARAVKVVIAKFGKTSLVAPPKVICCLSSRSASCFSTCDVMSIKSVFGGSTPNPPLMLWIRSSSSTSWIGKSQRGSCWSGKDEETGHGVVIVAKYERRRKYDVLCYYRTSLSAFNLL
jgi:hypothetical protein